MSEQPASFEDRMLTDCDKKGVTSVLYQTPSGNAWLFVSKDEPEPVTAFMKGMTDLMMTRGFVGTDGPVTIRRLTSGLIAPGKEVYWSVKKLDEEGIFADGYCKDEATARQMISDALLNR